MLKSDCGGTQQLLLQHVPAHPQRWEPQTTWVQVQLPPLQPPLEQTCPFRRGNVVLSAEEARCSAMAL